MDGKSENGSADLAASEMEVMLDQVIAALTRMDAEMLVELASSCLALDAGAQARAPEPMRSRLAWKLLTLERLLRQTRINLSVIGLGSREAGAVGRYQAMAGY